MLPKSLSTSMTMEIQKYPWNILKQHFGGAGEILVSIFFQGYLSFFVAFCRFFGVL